MKKTKTGKTVTENSFATAMAARPAHITALKKCESLASSDGRLIDVWELCAMDARSLRDWGANFRQHYCPDAEIDRLRAGTGLSRTDYLNQIVFPDAHEAAGPAIRAGDFAELLIADYVEFILGYWVPRGKYAMKAMRNESVKGVDIVGFRQIKASQALAEDTLLMFEVKAQLSVGAYSGALHNAVVDSSKDLLRMAMTLNATKRRLIEAGQNEKALVVQRFQNLADNPFQLRSGAAAVLTDRVFNDAQITKTTNATKHANAVNLEMVVVRGSDLMTLVHALFHQAANEA